jgi:hypothetical protein
MFKLIGYAVFLLVVLACVFTLAGAFLAALAGSWASSKGSGDSGKK